MAWKKRKGESLFARAGTKKTLDAMFESTHSTFCNTKEGSSGSRHLAAEREPHELSWYLCRATLLGQRGPGTSLAIVASGHENDC